MPASIKKKTSTPASSAAIFEAFRAHSLPNLRPRRRSRRSTSRGRRHRLEVVAPRSSGRRSADALDVSVGPDRDPTQPMTAALVADSYILTRPDTRATVRVIVGIDPGAHGAIAVLTVAGELLAIHDMPSIEATAVRLMLRPSLGTFAESR